MVSKYLSQIIQKNIFKDAMEKTCPQQNFLTLKQKCMKKTCLTPIGNEPTSTNEFDYKFFPSVTSLSKKITWFCL